MSVTELAEQGFDVKLDRVQRNVEAQGDRLIAQTSGDRRQHIDFAGVSSDWAPRSLSAPKPRASRAGRTEDPGGAAQLGGIDLCGVGIVR